MPGTAEAADRLQRIPFMTRIPDNESSSDRADCLVKPLDWIDFDGRGAKAQAFYEANYIIVKWSTGKFELSVSYPGYQGLFDGDRFHDSLEAAKAAAQADYARHILSSIARTGPGAVSNPPDSCPI